MKEQLLFNIREGRLDEIDLLEYVTDNDIDIAEASAASINASAAILDIAARDKDVRVRMATVNNPNTEKHTLEVLSNDEDKEIANIAIRRLEVQE